MADEANVIVDEPQVIPMEEREGYFGEYHPYDPVVGDTAATYVDRLAKDFKFLFPNLRMAVNQHADLDGENGLPGEDKLLVLPSGKTLPAEIETTDLTQGDYDQEFQDDGLLDYKWPYDSDVISYFLVHALSRKSHFLNHEGFHFIIRRDYRRLAVASFAAFRKYEDCRETKVCHNGGAEEGFILIPRWEFYWFDIGCAPAKRLLDVTFGIPQKGKGRSIYRVQRLKTPTFWRGPEWWS